MELGRGLPSRGQRAGRAGGHAGWAQGVAAKGAPASRGHKVISAKVPPQGPGAASSSAQSSRCPCPAPPTSSPPPPPAPHWALPERAPVGWATGEGATAHTLWRVQDTVKDSVSVSFFVSENQ